MTTRTPTQVASHAQKYFIRQHSVGKDKRRSSIHDITTVDAKSTSSDNDNKLLVSVQQPQQNTSTIGTGKGLCDWNAIDQGSLMAFNMPNSSQFMTPLRGTSTYGLQMQQKNVPRDGMHEPQLGYYNSVYRMQPTRRR